MTLHDWSEVATIAQGILALFTAIVATIAAILVYFQINGAHADNARQINAQREEGKKWKTLEICAQYEFNETVSAAAGKVVQASSGDKLTDEECAKLQREARVVLNYLDGIAIGVRQGLYIENLAKDHLKQIVKFHVDKLLLHDNCTRLRLDPNDYQFVIAMNKKWQQNQPYYRAHEL
jgi:hypothetical protein